MLNAGFQYLEQRDKDGLIAKNGVVSKESPFTTGDNNGVYDVIAEDLRWLYDNRTKEGGSGQVGPAGKDGMSAYDIAKKNGFSESTKPGFCCVLPFLLLLTPGRLRFV